MVLKERHGYRSEVIGDQRVNRDFQNSAETAVFVDGTIRFQTLDFGQIRLGDIGLPGQLQLADPQIVPKNGDDVHI